LTATGSRDVIRGDHFERMTSGAKLANAGYFDVEIVVDDLESMADRTTTPKSGVTRYHLPDGRHLDLLAEGRLVNLTGPYSQGHPAEVIDREVARRKLRTLGVRVDEETERQREYSQDWRHDDSSF
jgi:adenosylhomocysteinase